MSAVAAPLERSRVVARFQALPYAVRVAIALAFLMGFSLALRSTAIHQRYWIDEALSIGIASHPLHEIPGVLRQDGSPPLYYLLLGAWIRIFDVGEADTHGLSILFAIALVPVAFLAGRTMFGARAGWIAALLAAINPFLTYYAQETRMYSLAALLSLCATTAFVLTFVFRRRRWWLGFAISGTLLAYTHNWGLFLLAGSAITLLPVARAAPDPRGVARDALKGYGLIALLYLPWLPMLLLQARTTGAPWAEAPDLNDALNGVTTILGGAVTSMALLLGAGSGLTVVLGHRRRLSFEARAVAVIAAIFVATLGLAWLMAQLSPSWALRYFAVVIGPLLLLAAVGLARARNLGLVVAALLVLYWVNPRTDDPHAKSNAHKTAVLVRDRLEPRDIVVVAHPEQGPLMHLYLPQDIALRWADTMGFVKDPRVFDWRHALDRLRAAKPRPTADRLIRSLRPGEKILLVMPIIRAAHWGAPWTKLVRRRSLRWVRLLTDDPRLARTLSEPQLDGRVPRGVRAVLFERL